MHDWAAFHPRFFSLGPNFSIALQRFSYDCINNDQRLFEILDTLQIEKVILMTCVDQTLPHPPVQS